MDLAIFAPNPVSRGKHEACIFLRGREMLVQNGTTALNQRGTVDDGE
jgi:hypothetical protein